MGIAAMTDPLHDDRLQLIREFRQRLEDLARAGVDRIPAPVLPASPPRKSPLPSVATLPADGPGGLEEPPGVPRPPQRASAPVPAPTASAPRATAAPLAQVPSLFGEEPLSTPPVDPSDRPAQLAALAAEVAVCQRCPQ